MPTVIQERPIATDTGSGVGALAAVVVIIVLGVLFFLYALPALRDGGDTQINVPDRINVDTQ